MTNEKIIEKGVEKMTAIVDEVKKVFTDEKISRSDRDTKLHNLSERFSGIAEMMFLLTHKEYHWSTTDSKTFSLVSVGGFPEKEKIIYTV